MSEETTQTETAEPKPEAEIMIEPAADLPASASPAATTAPESIISTLEQRAQRRGCGVLILSTILGAVLGAVIALAVLAAVNGGTLAYNTSQIRRDITTAQEVQSNLSSQLENLSGQLEEVNGRLAALTTQGDQSAQSLTTAQENISQLQADISQIETDFDQVIAASQAVDEFLVAVRAMLAALPDGATIEPTPTLAP
jgi:septal ring factor EnvC (AmiA/AmiB activator)